MKKLILILLLLPVLSSCIKESKEIPDYRDKFIGTYNCDKTGSYHCGDSTFYYDTTMIVTITKENDSLINILDAVLNINSIGEFGGGIYPDSSYHGFGGYIVNDSIFFNTFQGGLGCFTSLNYIGKKL